MTTRAARGWPTAAVAVVYLVLALAAFAWSFGGPFDFDDLPAITNNQTIQPGRVADHPLATPPLGTATSGRPVVNLSFALNGAINRAMGVDRPTGLASPDAATAFRATNLLLHVLTALLLFAVARDTVGGEQEWAFVLAGVWLIHPLQTEAVSYIAQRTEIVASACYLTALLGAMRHRQTGKIGWVVLAVGAGLVGAGSKEIIATVPIVIALHDRAFFVDSWREVFRLRSRRWMYVALTAAVSVCVIADLQGARAATVGSGDGMTTLDYLVSQGWAIPRYVRLMLFPVGLSYDYGREPVVNSLSWLGLGGLIALGIVSVACWRSKDRLPLAFLGTTFLVLLAPSSSFVAIRTEIAAERRAYLALAIVLAAVGLLAVRLLRSARWTPLTRAAAGCVAAVLLVLSARRSAMYRSPLLLWTDATHQSPTNPRAFDGVGTWLLRADSSRLAEADSFFTHALALDSTYISSWIHRGGIAVKQNRLRDAETMYLRALSVAPDDSLATSRISKLYLGAGQPARAVPYMMRLVTASADPDALTDLGNAYFLLGQLDSAAMVLDRAIGANPRNGNALRWMGATLVEAGRAAESRPYLEHALATDTSSAMTYALLVSAYGKSGMREYAERAAWAAVAHARDDASIRVLTARGLVAAGDVEGANRLLAEAVKIEPRDAEAWVRLAMVQAQRGLKKEALTSVNHALSVVPGYPPAREALEILQSR